MLPELPARVEAGQGKGKAQKRESAEVPQVVGFFSSRRRELPIEQVNTVLLLKSRRATGSERPERVKRGELARSETPPRFARTPDTPGPGRGREVLPWVRL